MIYTEGYYHSGLGYQPAIAGNPLPVSPELEVQLVQAALAGFSAWTWSKSGEATEEVVAWIFADDDRRWVRLTVWLSSIKTPPGNPWTR